MPKYRMTIWPAIESGPHEIRMGFDSVEEIVASKNSCAALLLFIQDTAKVMRDYSNAFFLEENIGGEWQEYEEF